MSEPLEVAVRTAKVRVITDGKIAQKKMEVDGHKTEVIKTVSPIREAYVQCCDGQAKFQRKYNEVQLPSQIACANCGTTYGIERKNNNVVRVYGTQGE
jgi:hypothetical protein